MTRPALQTRTRGRTWRASCLTPGDAHPPCGSSSGRSSSSPPPQAPRPSRCRTAPCRRRTSQEIHLSLNPHERGTVPLVRDPVAVTLVTLGLAPLDKRHAVRLIVEDVEAPAHTVPAQLRDPVAVVRVLRGARDQRPVSLHDGSGSLVRPLH